MSTALAYLLIKQAKGESNLYRTVSTTGVPEWEGVDITDDDSLEQYRRRRAYSPARRNLAKGSILSALAGGLGGAALGGLGGLNRDRSLSGGLGGALLGGGLGALVTGGLPYLVGRSGIGLSNMLEDYNIDEERQAIKGS